MRGLARLLRRNPTDAERALWAAITADRRFSTLGFKRPGATVNLETDILAKYVWKCVKGSGVTPETLRLAGFLSGPSASEGPKPN